MLTVDYDRLGLQPGDRLLDLGCGFGRHAFEGLRRGASVVACDMSQDELVQVASMFSAMAAEGDVPPGAMAATTRGDATCLPFDDAAFDCVIASEVLEHIPDDGAAIAELARVLRPGGTLAVTVPAWLAERPCWVLSDEYHAPKAVGGHVRIYTENGLRSLVRGAGLDAGEVHRAHALHTPYWWLRCAVGPSNDEAPLVRAYHSMLVWDIERAPKVTRWTERLANPLLGKSLVLYAHKPAAAPAHPEAGRGAAARHGRVRSVQPSTPSPQEDLTVAVS